MVVICCLLSTACHVVRRKGPRFQTLLVSLTFCSSGTFSGLFSSSYLPQSAHRLFFRSREANHRDQEPLPDATWVLELDGSQWIIQAILHALHMHRPGFVSPG